MVTNDKIKDSESYDSEADSSVDMESEGDGNAFQIEGVQDTVVNKLNDISNGNIKNNGILSSDDNKSQTLMGDVMNGNNKIPFIKSKSMQPAMMHSWTQIQGLPYTETMQFQDMAPIKAVSKQKQGIPDKMETQMGMDIKSDNEITFVNDKLGKLQNVQETIMGIDNNNAVKFINENGNNMETETIMGMENNNSVKFVDNNINNNKINDANNVVTLMGMESIETKMDDAPIPFSANNIIQPGMLPPKLNKKSSINEGIKSSKQNKKNKKRNKKILKKPN